MKDALTVLGSAVVLAGFAAVGVNGTLKVSGDADGPSILDQVEFPDADPLTALEIDPLGNVLMAVEADAVVTHDGGDGGPMVAGPDIRGSRCARSVHAVAKRSKGKAFTVVCLPREYGLYERMNGRPAPTDPEE